MMANVQRDLLKTPPELFNITPRDDSEVRILTYLGEKAVNESRGISIEHNVPRVPHVPENQARRGTRQILDEKGPEGVVEWIKSQKKLLLTDTSFRDAHQSLMATRLRTHDMLRIAEPTAFLAGDLFSLEMWGGATFDVAYRFLK